MRLAAHLLVLAIGLAAGRLSVRPAPAPTRCPPARPPPAWLGMNRALSAPPAATAPPPPAPAPAETAASGPDRAQPAPAGEDTAGALAASGPSHEPWTYEAHQVLDRWERSAPITLRDRRCYQAGCVVELAYADPDALADALAESADREAGSWRGGLQAGALREGPDGRLIQEMVLLRPRTP